MRPEPKSPARTILNSLFILVGDQMERYSNRFREVVFDHSLAVSRLYRLNEPGRHDEMGKVSCLNMASDRIREPNVHDGSAPLIRTISLATNYLSYIYLHSVTDRDT